MLPNRSPVRAWLALAAFLCTFVLPLAGVDHLAAADDAACVTKVLTDGSPAGARLDDAGHDTDTEHCPLCHFQRAAGGAAPSHRTRIAAPAGQSVAVSAPTACRDVQAGQARSSRAPPVLL